MQLADFGLLTIALLVAAALGGVLGHEIGKRKGWEDARQFFDLDDGQDAGS